MKRLILLIVLVLFASCLVFGQAKPKHRRAAEGGGKTAFGAARKENVFSDPAEQTEVGRAVTRMASSFAYRNRLPHASQFYRDEWENHPPTHAEVKTASHPMAWRRDRSRPAPVPCVYHSRRESASSFFLIYFASRSIAASTSPLVSSSGRTSGALPAVAG